MEDRFSRLAPVLDEARAAGLLGPEPVERHVRHGRVLAGRVEPPTAFLDLGSGAGVPGLVLALAWPDARGTLLDSSERRTAFCGRAIDRLGLTGRVRVVRARAEEAGRDPALREQFDLVTARSFARPAVTAECAAPFLCLGGRLLVSEPPDAAATARALAAGRPPGRGSRPTRRRLGRRCELRGVVKVGPTPDRHPSADGHPDEAAPLVESRCSTWNIARAVEPSTTVRRDRPEILEIGALVVAPVAAPP